VYVGMDVHRKRSQVAIVDAAGAQQRDRNLANDPAKLVPVLGALPPGTPVAFEAAYGWGAGRSARRTRGWSRTRSIPAAVRPSPRPGRQERQGRRGHPGPAGCGRICCPRPGSRPRPPAICGPCCATGPGVVRLATSLTNRVHAVLADRGIPDHSGPWTGPGRAWLRRPRAASDPAGIIQDCCGLPDALATPIARLEREIARLAEPGPRVQALMSCPVSASSPP
jgi:transposase